MCTQCSKGTARVRSPHSGSGMRAFAIVPSSSTLKSSLNSRSRLSWKRQRRLSGIPQLPVLNDRSKVLSDTAYAEVMSLPAPRGDRAEALAIDAMQTERRDANIAIVAINKDRSFVYEDRTSKDLAKVQERLKMAAWVLSEECLSHSVLEEVKADGLFRSGPGETNPAHVIMGIIRRIIGGVTVGDIKQRMDLESALRAVKQENMATHLYCTKFKRNLLKCSSAGSTIPMSELIAIFDTD